MCPTGHYDTVIATVNEGEINFQFPLITPDDVVNNFTLGMDFLTKAEAILVITKRTIKFHNTKQWVKDSSSGRSSDTVINSTHVITCVIGPPSNPVVGTKHEAFIRQAPMKRGDSKQ